MSNDEKPANVDEKQPKPKHPEFHNPGHRLVYDEAWGEDVHDRHGSPPHKPYHFNVYEDVNALPSCTAFISDQEGVRSVNFANLEDAKAHYDKLIHLPDWAKAIREGTEGIKNNRVIWDDLL